jgi:hypothetical protein
MVSKLILAKNVALATAYASMFLAPGSQIASSSMTTLRVLNCAVVGHYVVYMARMALKARKVLKDNLYI